MSARRVILGLLLLPSLATAQGREPAEVARVRAEAAERCRHIGAEIEFGPDFLRVVNITPDRVPDYLLDLSASRCGEDRFPACGTAGCWFVVVASVNGRHRRVFDDHWKGVAVRRVGDRDHLDVGLECRGEEDECDATLAWNGARLAPVRRAPTRR